MNVFSLDRAARSLLVAGGVLFCALWLIVAGGVPAVAQTSEVVPQSPGQIALSFAPVVRAAAPAVVNIYTRKQIDQSALNPFAADPFFRFFFEDFGRRRPPPRQQNSLGSGVIVASDGLIVTNHHVVEDADEIMVVLHDRREFEAVLVGGDAAADLALLRIDADEELPALPMGESDSLEVGDLVLAIGNPFGIGQTVTSGIVSAIARSSPQVNDDLSFIQTDAAINPGNSGGALVALDGRLVGVNTAIFTRSGGSIGIGFAIPIDLVKALIRSVEGGGKGLARPWLGAQLQSVDGDLAQNLGLARPYGVVLLEVHPFGPAARAGLKKGDVILAIDGVEIVDGQGLNFRLALGRLGATVPLEVWREGKAQAFELVLETPPYDPAPDIRLLRGSHALAGATVANLSPGFNRDIGFDLFLQGVAVLDTEPGAPAYRLGLETGDLILAIDGRSIQSTSQLNDEMERLVPPWELQIERGGRNLEVTIGR